MLLFSFDDSAPGGPERSLSRRSVAADCCSVFSSDGPAKFPQTGEWKSGLGMNVWFCVRAVRALPSFPCGIIRRSMMFPISFLRSESLNRKCRAEYSCRHSSRRAVAVRTASDMRLSERTQTDADMAYFCFSDPPEIFYERWKKLLDGTGVIR